MATIAGYGRIGNNGYWRHTWEGLDSGDQGGPASQGRFPDKTVAVEGTFGGGTVTIEGSQDGTTWHTLSDPQGNDLEFTTAGIALIAENPLFIRPDVSGGTDSDITVRLGAGA